jgi:predicted transposase/invertase (TIGR01784 family)
MKKRSLYYLSRLYSEQLKQGDKYRILNGAIGINILNFNLLNNDRYHNHYLFKENETNEIYTDLIQIHIIELPKFNKNPNEIKDDLKEKFITEAEYWEYSADYSKKISGAALDPILNNGTILKSKNILNQVMTISNIKGNS